MNTCQTVSTKSLLLKRIRRLLLRLSRPQQVWVTPWQDVGFVPLITRLNPDRHETTTPLAL